MGVGAAAGRHLDAIRTRDLAGVVETLADDVVMVLGDGRVLQGKDLVAQFHEEWFDDPDWSFELHPVYRVVRDGMVVQGFRVEYLDVDHEGSSMDMTYVLSLTFSTTRDGRWRVVHVQNTF
jgi:uncharacterized protein (TIGR02246 family)